MNPEIKESIHQFCLQTIQERIKEIGLAVELAQEAIESDTKGSAGDKYETSREMLQQDLTRYANQLLLAKEDLALLSSIDRTSKRLIGLGSLVETNQGIYYISIGIGKVELADTIYYAISPLSPLAKVLNGRQINEEVSFNSKRFLIENIT